MFSGGGVDSVTSLSWDEGCRAKSGTPDFLHASNSVGSGRIREWEHLIESCFHSFVISKTSRP